MFEPNNDKLEDSYLSAPEALVYFDTNNNTLVLENHGCEPVYLEPGQELGQLERVALHVAGNANNNNPSNQSVNSVAASPLDEQNEVVSAQEKQK